MHLMISLRANVPVNSDVQSSVFHPSKGRISVPRVLSVYCEKDQNTGGGVALKSCAELGKAERERRYAASAQGHTAGEWPTPNTKPPYKPHPSGPACCHAMSFLKPARDITPVISVGLILLCRKRELLLKYQPFVFICLAKHLFPFIVLAKISPIFQVDWAFGSNAPKWLSTAV